MSEISKYIDDNINEIDTTELFSPGVPATFNVDFILSNLKDGKLDINDRVGSGCYGFIKQHHNKHLVKIAELWSSK